MVPVGMKIPQDGNRANTYEHVAVVHGHVWAVQVCCLALIWAVMLEPETGGRRRRRRIRPVMRRCIIFARSMVMDAEMQRRLEWSRWTWWTWWF